MADHRAERAALDLAILEHIRTGGHWHPMYSETCRQATNACCRLIISQIIADRLQALRKAGKIKHVGKQKAGKDHGWVLIDG